MDKKKYHGLLSHPEESLDKNYAPILEKYIKELRRMDEETKKDGGVVDWDYILTI
tara:strand:+ start:233 stop:397 length:165 start_codon:yes stop_codon:yes gene_type:complete